MTSQIINCTSENELETNERIHSFNHRDFLLYDIQSDVALVKYPNDMLKPIDYWVGSLEGDSQELSHLKGKNRSWVSDDIAFKRLLPKEYRKIASKIVDTRYKREQLVDQYINQLRLSLKKEGIPACISGRPKHFYSTFRKMLRKNLPIEKIQDLLAVRLVTTTISNCYHVLEIAQLLWKPVKGLYRDYVKKPKVNGYRSLHTTVQGENRAAFEIQIRTREMHHYAEMGNAAHSIYKGALLTRQ